MVIHNAILTGSISMQAPPVISGSLTLTGSINATGDITASSARFSNIITAQTLVVQTVSSSTEYASGSNIFGNLASNTHVFTGSMSVSGSGTFAGALSGTTSAFTTRVDIGTRSSGNIRNLNIYGATNGNAIIKLDGADGNGYGAQVDFISKTSGGTSNTWTLGTGVTGGANAFELFNGATNVLNFAQSTGAATFSSSVTADRVLTAINTNNSTLVAGSIEIQSFALNNSWIGDNIYFNGSGFVARNTGYTSQIYFEAAGNIAFKTSPSTVSAGSASNNVNRMVITSGGNVGIGTSSPFVGGNPAKLQVRPATDINIGFQVGTADSTGIKLNAYNDAASVNVPMELNGSIMILKTGETERMRITSQGQTQFIHSQTDLDILYARNGSASPYGMNITFTAASPNNGTNNFTYFADSSGLRCKVMSNGGIANYSANNSNISDERTKKDIILLESYWDKFKAIEIVKFKYKDQTHDDFNIGVIAQQLESVAPEFVNVDGFDKDEFIPEDGIPLKSIYEADLHHATIKVLQEAMAKIETLEAQIDELKNK
jgi:hypothetical protein